MARLIDIWLPSAGFNLSIAIFVFAALSLLLSVSPKVRAHLLSHLPLRSRQKSDARTPPRSLSPTAETEGVKRSLEPSYRDVFPPQVNEKAPPPALRQPMAMEVPFSEQHPSSYTPTGFSKSDIEALGDFPDYASLSGVPNPQPYRDYNLSTAQHRPYRPFRWPYHQTMSLQKLDPDFYLELTSTYKATIAQRLALHDAHPTQVLQALPGSEQACKEVMEIALSFYLHRHPALFTLSPDKRTFHNHILDTTTDLRATTPLHVLLHNVPEDFAITLRNPATGLYHFRAGVICSSLGWSVATKIGLPLAAVHAPVPDYPAKLQFSMDRYFARTPTARAIQRGSWGLERGTPLFMPPGDAHEALREHQDPALRLDDVMLRVDWQTLRRVPLSGAVVFGFRAVFTPVARLRGEPGVPGLLLRVLHEGAQGLMRYKGTWHVEHVVEPALREWVREQGREGEEVGTLGEYPFFEGWEEGWHAEQGF